MSYDFYIYSPSEQPVAKEDLKAELENQGWKVYFASYGIKIEAIVASTGPLEKDAFLLTCETDDENLPCFLEASENNDIETLNLMLDTYQIDFCGINWSPFDFNNDYPTEAWETNSKFFPEGYGEALKQARTHYALDVSYEEFYIDVAHAIGIIVGGMLEDPQQDDAIEFIARRKK